MKCPPPGAFRRPRKGGFAKANGLTAVGDFFSFVILRLITVTCFFIEIFFGNFFSWEKKNIWVKVKKQVADISRN
jgi:hypothetical protein